MINSEEHSCYICEIQKRKFAIDMLRSIIKYAKEADITLDRHSHPYACIELYIRRTIDNLLDELEQFVAPKKNQ